MPKQQKLEKNVPEEKGVLPGENHELTSLLQKIFKERSMDFREYKKTSLRRRISKRLEETGTRSYKEYIKILDKDPEEYSKLFEALLINVTSFFRDPEAFTVLEKEVLPNIISRKKKGDTIRIWSAGCASGEEAYSIAMLLAEVLNERFREFDIRVYATDIDENALGEARRGIYKEDKIKDVKKDYLLKYFTREDGNYRVSRTIRQMVVFGVHNLTADAPISHLDLIVCRNVLIYFDVNLQNKVMTRFHYALHPNGYIFFGKSESLLLGSDVFKPVNKNWRIFQKVPEIMVELTKKEGQRAKREEILVKQAVEEGRVDIHSMELYFQGVVQNIGVAILVADKDEIVTTVNKAWEDLWSVKAREVVGARFRVHGLLQQVPDAERWLEVAIREKRATRNVQVEIADQEGDRKFLELSFVPLVDPHGNPRGTTVLANDISSTRKLMDDLKKSNEELQSLNEKLETTNEELVSSNEELETTTEELQSTAQELQTNNEELQSTNEELEATNEELTSANEELETMNDELRSKTEMLDTGKLFEKHLVENLNEGLVELDDNGNVQELNTMAEEILGLKRDKVIGKNLLLVNSHEETVSKLRKLLKDSTDKLRPVTERLNYVPNSGKKKVLRIKIVRVADSGREDVGSILLVQDITKVKQLDD